MTGQGAKDTISLQGSQSFKAPQSIGQGTQSLRKEKLVLLEVGRAIAAVLVVLHHADQATAHFSDVVRERIFMWGQYGVDFFFVLSGFIIFYTHGRDREGLAPAQSYLFKRITRIFIPYLPVAFAWMALLFLFEDGTVTDRSWGFWATLTLLPMEKSSTLTVAWTLTYELLFYGFFLLAYLRKELFVAASVMWSGLLLFSLFGGVKQAVDPVLFALTNTIILEFFCGVLAAAALSKADPKLRWWILLAGVCTLAAVVAFWAGQRAVLGIPLALIVLACAMFRPDTQSAGLDWAVFLGAASYAIYLVHSPVISVTAEVFQSVSSRFIVFAICVFFGVFAGIIYHLVFEKPALRWARRLSSPVPVRS